MTENAPSSSSYQSQSFLHPKHFNFLKSPFSPVQVSGRQLGASEMPKDRIVESRTPSTTSPSRTSTASSPTEPSVDGEATREPLYLPDEIVLAVLSHFPPGEQSQGALWTCCMISRQWYVKICQHVCCTWVKCSMNIENDAS